MFSNSPHSWHPCRPPAGSGWCCGVRCEQPDEAECGGEFGSSWDLGERSPTCTPPAGQQKPSDHSSGFTLKNSSSLHLIISGMIKMFSWFWLVHLQLHSFSLHQTSAHLYILMQLPPQGFPFIIMQKENHSTAVINYSFTLSLTWMVRLQLQLSRENTWLYLNISRPL